MSGGGANSAHEPEARQSTTSAQPRPFMRTILAFRRMILLVAGALVLGFALGFIWFLARVPSPDAALDRNAEGIVALTGGAARISDAIELLAAGRGHRLLITGVNPATHTGELARLAPQYQRLFGCCIDLDHSAVNTIGNAIETRRWTQARGFRSLLVVTSAYHMPRAIGAFRRAGFAVEACPVDWRTRGPIDLAVFFESVSVGLIRTDTAIHEWIGLAAYWLSGRSSDLFPAP